MDSTPQPALYTFSAHPTASSYPSAAPLSPSSSSSSPSALAQVVSLPHAPSSTAQRRQRHQPPALLSTTTASAAVPIAATAVPVAATVATNTFEQHNLDPSLRGIDASSAAAAYFHAQQLGGEEAGFGAAEEVAGTVLDEQRQSMAQGQQRAQLHAAGMAHGLGGATANGQQVQMRQLQLQQQQQHQQLQHRQLQLQHQLQHQHHQPAHQLSPQHQLQQHSQHHQHQLNGGSASLSNSAVGGHFGILTMQPTSPHTPSTFHDNNSNPVSMTMSSSGIPLPATAGAATMPTAATAKPSSAHFPTLQHVPNPPDLAAWRQRLFDVAGTIRLSAAQFATYFPHVDNIYSHRSTQRYKRKPFVSHYWDCRLKGRPPGTPKSDDPGKRKRKRTARERDLCDVKIKITEYFPGAFMAGADANGPGDVGAEGGADIDDELSGHLLAAMDVDTQQGQTAGKASSATTIAALPTAITTISPTDGNAHVDASMGPPSGGMLMDWTGLPGERYFTIQRVNGNGGNGKGDGVPGPHKHTLEESDRVKKNSVQRREAELDKERRKVMKPFQKKASGAAMITLKKHSREHDLKLYGNCTDPATHAVWIALESKALGYQYFEVDPHKKAVALRAAHAAAPLPAMVHGTWVGWGVRVLLEFIEDLHPDPPLFADPSPQGKGTQRMWVDYIVQTIPPIYTNLLGAPVSNRTTHLSALCTALVPLLAAAHPTGPLFHGSHVSLVDVTLAPWAVRLRVVLAPHGWRRQVEGVNGNGKSIANGNGNSDESNGWEAVDSAVAKRWWDWEDAIVALEGVRRTVCGAEFYAEGTTTTTTSAFGGG